MISRKNILELQARKRIYQFISKNPELHLREISRKMNIPKTTLKYHLKYLEKQDLVSAKFENRYKRYCITNKLGIKDKEILNLLRQEVTRKIILYFMFYLICSQKELSKALGKHPSTIDFHLRKLMEKGLIKPASANKGEIMLPKKGAIKRNIKSREIIYIFSDEELYYTIYGLLIAYKDSLPDMEIINENLLSKDTKECLLKRKPLQWGKCNGADIAIDLLIELWYEIFPDPYHA